MKNYKEKLNNITTFCFDVDGVFTDGIVYLSSDGDQVRTANVKDGFAVQHAVKMGYRLIIISGGRSEMVRKRFEGLGVSEIHLASSNKVEVLNKIISDSDLKLDEVCYMGDDIPDLKVLKMVGLATCPSDADSEVKEVCDYISPKGGGKGCVRDILEQCMRIQGKWFSDELHIW